MNRETVKAQVDFRDVAAALAHMNADEQGEFLNVFARELLHNCETNYRMEIQAHAIADQLKEPAQEMVITLAYRFTGCGTRKPEVKRDE